MRLVTFGLDDQGKLVICFPIFIKEYKKEPMTLYQIETVKYPLQIPTQKQIATQKQLSQNPIWLQIKNTTYSWYSLN